ncbi:MAG: UDP-N-acetylmuramoyl-tripeptide--D-alanyl-D-alanine ligase [Anaerolineae bacterium]
MMLTLADCVEFLAGAPKGTSDVTFSDVVINSREVRPGDLFVALPGERTDGHRFVDDALANGAAGALIHKDVALNPQPAFVDVRQPITPKLLATLGGPVLIRVPDTLSALQQIAAGWRARFPVRTIGITGSVGKTTAKETVAAVLSQRYDTLKSESNLNNEIGLPLTLLRLRSRHQRAVLEMGMYARGEIAQLAAIAQPHIGIVTNVGPSHLERLGSLDAIAEAKAELVEALPADGTAILNADDPVAAGMSRRTPANTFTYGLSREADLWADNIESLGLDGISFQLHYRGESLHVKVPMLGRHSVHTSLAAAGVGLVDNLSWQEILDGLQEPRGQLRLVVVPGINGSTILDDTYNASPDSTLAALNLLDDLNGRTIAVLGGMLELGDYEVEGHEKVGARAAAVLDGLIVVGELGRMIGETALEAGMASESVLYAADNAAAIDRLREILRSGDTVLIKGSRSLEMEEIVAAIAQTSDQ